MRQLLYVSKTAQPVSLGDLDDILTASRRNNAQSGITGLLLFIDDGFLQVLEGDEKAVRDVYARVARDPRHGEAMVMLDREIPVRAFPEWSMGFERPCMDDPETAGMFGVAREAINGRLSPATGRIVAMMLQTFYAVQHSDLPVNLYYAG